jgi:gamma-glutamylcyclotransferase (GGCT)/AIG2-like uncharacterized protein YtfP
VSSPARDVPGDPFTLYVYGTLMRGGVRHGVLSGQRFLGETRTLPRYALFDLGAYPGLVHRETDGRSVHGELYEVAAALRRRLDDIEGAPSLYRLGPVLIGGFAGEAFTYFYQQDTHGLRLCPGDRWRNEGAEHDA